MTEARAKDEGRASAPAQKSAAKGAPAVKAAGDGAEPAARTATPAPPISDEQAAKVAKALANKIIRFNCLKCKKELRVPIANAGKEGKCPHCGEKTLAPAVKFISTKKAPAKKAAAAPAKPKAAEKKAATRLLPPGMKIAEKKVSLRDTFGVTKVKCPGCGLTQVFQKNRTTRFEECHACGKVITFPES